MQRQRCGCHPITLILLGLALLLGALLVSQANKEGDARRAATATQHAIYQQWDNELHATMTAEAPVRRK